MIETILSSRAPSTRRLYGLKWNMFSTWCRERGWDPVNCPVASVLEFLGYVPKVPSNVARQVVLQASHFHLLCPVRALNSFIQKSSHWRRSEQLLVCFGSPKKGLPASKQTISNWIIQAIVLAYQVHGLPSTVALRAHSSRGKASSRALLSGVPLQEICDVAGWSTPHTFIWFYSLILPSMPGARALSS